ncbi:lipopolysaccharide biosynthesis protein [Stutzerimonas nitrititolerans]|uniref:lipopolysaccharide biosynthesis protein n=1 Tax=Stutzerimonas nitrititolerans TaxID=2482751 RepID=UPI003F7F049F
MNKLLGNVVALASGTATAQFLTLMFLPVLTRLYGPEAFGMYGTFMALFMILAPLSVLSYSVAIVLPKSDEEAKGLMVLSVVVGLIVFGICLLFFILFLDSLAAFLKLELSPCVLFLIPFSLLFYGVYQVFNYWLLRIDRYKALGFFSALSSVVNNILRFGAYYISPTGFALILCVVLQYFAHSLMLVRYVYLSSRLIVIPLSYKYFISLATRYKDYPLFRTPQILINSLSNSIPVIIIASLFTQEEVGYFTLAWSITSAPALLIGQAIGGVFYPEITKKINIGDKVDHLLVKLFSILASISFVPFLIIFMFGDVIFSKVFGNTWLMAGQYASYLTVAVFLGLVHRPCEAYIQAANRNKSYALFEASSLILSVILMYMAYSVYLSSTVVVQAFVCAKALYYIVMMAYSYLDSRSNNPITRG